uniref:Uncharacterized protein n=1 Tax=Panagrolaimus sp. PS1159 TaxID=55785 RepID=A0AC35EZB6_9BILA
MWLVVFCFVFPAALFSVCGLLAWYRMWNLQKRREAKLFQQLEAQTKQRYEKHMQCAHPTIIIGRREEIIEENPENF